MWNFQSCLLCISVTLLILIHNIIMINNAISYFPTNLIPDELDFKLNIVHRMKSQLLTKITAILCGTTICTVYWIIILLVRIKPKYINHYQYRLYFYCIRCTWSLFILPYVIFSSILSIYTMLILLDDIGFLKNDTSYHLYAIFDALDSTEFSANQKVQLINYLEGLQYDFSCCGGKSFMNWLLSKHSIPVEYLRGFNASKYILEQEVFNPWNLREHTEFLPLSCCDRNRSLYCSMEVLNPNTTLDFDQISQIVPVYTRDCVTSITLQMTSELNSMTWMYSSLNISLHLLQLFLNVKTYEIVSANFPCKTWSFIPAKFHRNLTPPSKNSVEYSTGSINRMAGSITYVDSSLMHYDDSALTGSVTTVKRPEKLAHSSGSITNNEGAYIHQTLPKTHNDNSKTHRTESKMYTDGSREYKDGTITPGPYDARQDCLLGRTIHLFYGPAGYVSTTKLLEACQNFHLYARPSEEKLQDLSSKVDHIEKKMHIGWVLKDSSKEQSFTFYVPRLDFKNTKLKHSHEFRYYLRNRLPLLEALLYADGNDLVNREANYIYRSYSVFILRAVIFLIIGYVASKLILLIINNVQSSNALLDKVSHQNGEHDNPYSWINKRYSEDIRKIMEIVERQTKVLVTITIMVGVLISLRVRCLLFLMIPTFGLVVGHVYLANQMIYTSFIGPLTSSEYNMKSVSSVLSCLSKAAYSISRDFNKFDYIGSTVDNVSKFSADLILSPNEETFYPLDHISVSSSLLEVIRDTGEKLSSTVVDYKNNLPSLDKLTENYKNLTEKFESSYSKNEISKIHHELARNLSITMKERLDQRIEKYKHDVRHYLEREISSNANNYFNMNIVSQGMEMEYEMLNNLIHFCMIIHERKFASCLNKAKEICNDLQNNRQFQGSWFSSLCDDHFQAEEFCDLFNYIKAVRQECSVEVISFAPEFGLFSYLKESYESLNVLNSSMKVEIFLNESFINKQSLIWKEWEKENKHMDKPVTSSMNILYYSLLLLTTLLRLTFLLLIYTVHKYISNYLLNVNFDNLYCEPTCEMIDRKRLKEVRETLFPLKLSEKSFVLWTKFGYTWKNIKKSLFRLFFVIFLGLALLCIFYLDHYMHHLIISMDELLVNNTGNNDELSDDIQRFTTGFTTNITEGTYAKVIGNGLFKEMINKLLQSVGHLKQINLDYNVDHCAKSAYETDPTHKAHFYSVWMIFTILSLISIGLLRIRHRIVKFFYPAQTRRRAVALYNYLLAQRRNQLTKSRHRIIHCAQLGRLQEEVERLSQPSFLARLCSQLACLLGMDKVTCVICSEQFEHNTDILICPIDNAAFCQSCLLTIMKDNVCIACLDRDPKQLFKESRKIQKMLNRLSQSENTNFF